MILLDLPERRQAWVGVGTDAVRVYWDDGAIVLHNAALVAYEAQLGTDPTAYTSYVWKPPVRVDQRVVVDIRATWA